LSDFKEWKQISHANTWLIFPENIGKRISIDEVALSQGELYTIIAMVKGTKAETVIKILQKMPLKIRNKVEEITLDMAGNMGLIVKKSFPNAVLVIDRFHVQKLALDALQEIRIKHRWEVLDQENEAIEKARSKVLVYTSELLSNGDTLKQLLARSHYLLYKNSNNHTKNQIERAKVLFELYPDIEKAYKLCQNLSWIFNQTKDKTSALIRLAKWDEKVRQAQFKSFNTIARTMSVHYQNILNYFDNRSTNASAESFNAKIKAFRTQFRGVRNIEFFLFRRTHIFA
jgi:transposase